MTTPNLFIFSFLSFDLCVLFVCSEIMQNQNSMKLFSSVLYRMEALYIMSIICAAFNFFLSQQFSRLKEELVNITECWVIFRH